MHNLCQSYSELHANHIYIQIIILPNIDIKFLGINIIHLCNRLHAVYNRFFIIKILVLIIFFY